MDKKIYWNIAGCIFFLCALFSGYLVYTNLNKGLIFNDEAYYLFHFREYREVLTVDASNFFRIFQGFYSDNIFRFRVTTYLLLNTSTFLLFFLSARYFRLKIPPIFIGFLGIFINFITWNASNIVLHQYIGNTILTNFSLSFLVLFLQYKKYFYLGISGFFLGILLFDGVPHIGIFLSVGLFLLFHFWKKEKKNLGYFSVGILVAVIVYFCFIESFSEFISQLDYLKIYKQFHIKQHPKSFYFYWIAKVLGFVFIPGLLGIVLIEKLAQNKIKITDTIICIVAVATIVSVFFSPFTYLNYFLLLLLLYRFWLSNKTIEQKTLLILFYSVPFCLAFGSGAYFNIRAGQYQIYYFLTLVIIIVSLYQYKVFLTLVLYFVYQIVIFPNFISEKGWKDFVFEEQTEPVEINGYTLLLDKQRKKDIEDLRPYLQNQPKVIYSSNHLMGYLYILHAKPPIPYYFTLKNYVKFIIEKKGDQVDDYIYLESNDYPFSPKEILPLHFVNNPKDYQVVKTGRFTVYLPKKFKKK